jgi:hypothetical protein
LDREVITGMATYKDIQAYIRKINGFTVKTCWIADVRAGYGLTTRVAPNRIDPSKPVYPCPPEKRSPIEGALRHFGMIQ